MKQSLQKNLFSGTGLIVLAVLMLALVALGNQLLRGARIDLTENNIYTLSDGTRALLEKIDEPINLYFFYSRETARQFPSISNYASRVQDMLDELVAAADGRLRLTVIEPEPFSDAEDRAVQMGVQQVPVNDSGQNLYFGLAGTNSVDDQQSIAFFQANRESLLEYDLAKLIHELSRTTKPVVGLLSTLPLDGGFNPARMQQTPPWVAIEQLRRFFEVKTLQNDLTRVPDDVDLLLLVHPADLSERALYAIDQYVVGGGRALVFVDALAESVSSAAGGPATVETESNPADLLKAWGLELRAGEVLADRRHALRVSGGQGQPAQSHYALISLAEDSMNPEDVITRELKRINLAFSGILQPVEGSELEVTTLIHSSRDAQPMDSSRVQGNLNVSNMLREFQASGESYAVAVRVRGTVRSAFPDGAPKAVTDDRPSEAPEQHHAVSAEPVNLVVVADTDLLADQMWVRQQQFLGRQIATPWADNGDFLVSAADNLLGSNDLISIRSRAGYARPFDRVDQLKREAESQFLTKALELEERLQETERKLGELQRSRDDGSAVILSEEQQAALARFRQDQIDIRKELRDVRHQLDRDIENLGTQLKFINIALVPLLLTVVALGVAVARRRSRAREVQA